MRQALRAAAALLAVALPLQPPKADGRSLVLAVGGEPDTGFDPLMGWGRYGNPPVPGDPPGA